MPSYPIHILTWTAGSLGLASIGNPTLLQKLESASLPYDWMLAFGLTVVLFSILPDIDSKRSKISWILHLTVLVIIAWLYLRMIPFNAHSILLIGFIGYLEIYNNLYARNHRTHRQFPHTFTFGALCTGVLYLITGSEVLTMLGAFCFVLHLVLDMHVTAALSGDARLWRKVFLRK